MQFWCNFICLCLFLFCFCCFLVSIFFYLFAFLSFQCSLMGIYQTSRIQPNRRDPCEYCKQKDLRPGGILMIVAIKIDLQEMPHMPRETVQFLFGWKLLGHWTTAFVFPPFFNSFSHPPVAGLEAIGPLNNCLFEDPAEHLGTATLVSRW